MISNEIEIQNVSYAYGETSENVINHCNLNISRGKCILLCGRSGSGKSTITKLINGLIPHFETGRKSGTVYVASDNVEDTPMYVLSGKAASVFQNPKSQFFNTDPESEIVFSLENQSVPLDVIDRRLEQTVEELGIRKLMDKTMFGMSGGEKQIVAFACAYASKAEVIVLDEPSANLDSYAASVIASIITKMKEQGKTIIIAEHRVAYLAGLIDDVYFIENGTLSHTYTADEFYSKGEGWRKKHGLRCLNNLHFPKLSQLAQNLDKSESHSLKIQNINLSYGKNSVAENISFTLQSGEVTALIGPNGAGKTTLSRCICGLHKERSGQILLDEKPLNKKQRNKESYLVMQDVNHQLFAESVEAECILGNEAVSADYIDDILHKFSLYKYKDQHPQSLSGGQKQRLAVAVAILSGKKILIFDEPTSGLDYDNMYKVGEFIKQLSQKGYIIMIVTHDFEFIETACTRCISLEKEGIIEVKSLEKESGG